MAETIVTVGDVMRPELKTIDGLRSVREAIAKMRQVKTSSLIIERRHEGDEYGVVTVQDIAGKVISTGRSVDRTSVYEIMTKPALTVSADMNIKYAIRLLVRLRVRRALVTRGGNVVGYVSQRDMVVRYIDEGGEE